MSNGEFCRTIVGKSTFRTQNGTDKANFRCTADKNVFFLIAGHKGLLIALCWANKSIFRPTSRKKSCATWEKHSFSLVAQFTISVLYTIFFLLGGQKMDLFAPQGTINCTFRPTCRKKYLF